MHFQMEWKYVSSQVWNMVYLNLIKTNLNAMFYFTNILYFVDLFQCSCWVFPNKTHYKPFVGHLFPHCSPNLTSPLSPFLPRPTEPGYLHLSTHYISSLHHFPVHRSTLPSTPLITPKLPSLPIPHSITPPFTISSSLLPLSILNNSENTSISKVLHIFTDYPYIN